MIAGVVRRWGARYVRHRLRRDLDGVHAAGLERARALLEAGPVVFAANHVSWFDGLIYVLLAEALGGEHRVLVGSDGLSRHPYFRAFGALPVDGIQGVRAALAHLDRPGHALWLFPQGEHRHPHRRPLGLRQGVRLLGRAGTVVPVALDYVFVDAPRPRARVHLGAPLRGGLPHALELALSDALGAMAAGAEGPLLLPGRPERDGAARLLGWLWRLTEGGDG